MPFPGLSNVVTDKGQVEQVRRMGSNPLRSLVLQIQQIIKFGLMQLIRLAVVFIPEDGTPLPR